MGVLSGAPKPYDWDALVRAWADTRPQALWRRHSDSVCADLLRRWLPSSLHSVLKTDAFDEAVSEGVYPELAQRAGAVVAIYVALTALMRARERHRALLCARADVRRLPFRRAAFDAVVSLSTLDHFDSRTDIETSLAELVRVLRPGGTLILTLDNLSNPIIALRAVLPFRLLHAAGVVPYQIGRTCRPAALAALRHARGPRGRRDERRHALPTRACRGAGKVAQRTGNPRLQRAFLDAAGRMERLRTWPTRFVTGHFVAVRALKPPQSGR